MYDTVVGNNKNNYDNITSAIFHILNNMTSSDMRTVLFSHAENYRLLNRKNKLRVNIKDYVVMNNHNRVLETINYLQDVEGISMP